MSDEREINRNSTVCLAFLDRCVAPKMVPEYREGRHGLISTASLSAVAPVYPQSSLVRVGPREKVDDGAYYK